MVGVGDVLLLLHEGEVEGPLRSWEGRGRRGQQVVLGHRVVLDRCRSRGRSGSSGGFTSFVDSVVVEFVVKEQRLEVRDASAVGLSVQLLEFVPVAVEVDAGGAGALPGQERLHALDEPAAGEAEVGAKLNAHGGGGCVRRARVRVITAAFGYGLPKIWSTRFI